MIPQTVQANIQVNIRASFFLFVPVRITTLSRFSFLSILILSPITFISQPFFLCAANLSIFKAINYMTDVKRSLNLFDTIMLVSGSMIGSGIFIVTADMMRVLGSPVWVLLCWIISGVITLLAALSYGELAGMMPEAGGQFVYLKRAFGKITAFVYGWTVFSVIQTGVIAAVAVAFARYVGVLFPFFDERNFILETKSLNISTSQLLAVVMVFFLSWLNSRGINNGRIIQRVFTSTKILALVSLIIIGFAFGSGTGYWQTNITMPLTPSTAGEFDNGIVAI